MTLAFPEVLLYFDTNSPGRPGDVVTYGENVAVFVYDGHACRLPFGAASGKACAYGGL
ncbi:hypothetical protein D3C80_2176980 [compost metagenome]